MFILVSLPIWLAIIIFILRALARSARRSNGKIQRTIVTPDGRRETFLVPASEPASVTIARMHAHDAR